MKTITIIMVMMMMIITRTIIIIIITITITIIITITIMIIVIIIIMIAALIYEQLLLFMLPADGKAGRLEVVWCSLPYVGLIPLPELNLSLGAMGWVGVA